MLTELDDIQESSEVVHSQELSIEIETRVDGGPEKIDRKYTFSYAPEWDKWTFVEYTERRGVGSEWHESRNIMWHETDKTPEIDIPPEVADALAKATGANSITIQVPTSNGYESVYES